jgi:hypothetical protein
LYTRQDSFPKHIILMSSNAFGWHWLSNFNRMMSGSVHRLRL